MRRRASLGAVMVLALGLGACQTAEPGIGTLGGAVAGGLIGSAFGAGAGKTAAIIGGAVLGGALGNVTIDRARQDRYYNNYQSWY